MSNREELEQAIAHLESQRAMLGDAIVDASVAALRKQLAELEPAPQADQQRKQVTVLFADVSGFTPMSETMDAEDVAEMMNALWARLDDVIREHGGYIDKHIGDAVMALWGVQTAREDDPEQAIRAALTMQAELGNFRDKQNADLSVRIGINTGPVLLGEVGTTGEFTAIGDTVNVTSRLEGAAPLDGVLISHATYQHVRGVFDVQPQEPLSVKGKAEPLQVYLVQRAKPRAFRMGTRGVEGIETRMIGREAELKRLQDAFYTVIQDGECQMITIVGEAGVGKSRLLYEFENWVDLLPEQFYLFKGRASQEMQNLPYALIRDLFTFRFQIQDSDPAGVVWEKIEGGICETLGEACPEQSRGDDEGRIKAHFIGQLLGFDFSASPHLQGVLDDAIQVRDRALIYISDYFKAMAAQNPVLILLEDLHWADDSSLDALNRLALATSDHPLLIGCSARPVLYERRPHWGVGQAFHTQLALGPLSKRDSRRLVEEVLQKAGQVPEALRELVVSGAEGNPFYVEELIKMLIEDGVIIKGEERWRVEPARLTAVRVPPTLTGVLQARLDSLPPEERSLLQQASVVGRIFWDDTVVMINESAQEGIDNTGIPETLSTLRGREMVFRRETSAFAGTQEFIFKHAILREVTYESVLKRIRRAYHALVADWLIEQGGERVNEFLGLIADHLELAGRTAEALTYLRRAGEQAAARFANAEAVNHLSRALDLTPQDRWTERYDLLLAREKIYDLQGAREAQAQDLEALDALAEALGDDRQRVEVALRRTNHAEATSDYPGAIAAAQAAIGLAQAARDVDGEAMGYLGWGRALLRLGEYEAAHSQLEQALAQARAGQLHQVEADSLRSLGLVYRRQGDFVEAGVHHEQCLRIYREIGDRRGEGDALNNLGGIFFDQGDCSKARAYFEEALRIYREIGYRGGEGIALQNLGNVFLFLDDRDEGRTHYEGALRVCREIGDRRVESRILYHLGYLSDDLGDFDEARAYYEEALCLQREIGDREGESMAFEALGYLYDRLGDYDEARAYLEDALCLSREIGYRLQEGLALVGLSLIYHHKGDDTAAQEHSQQALIVARETGDRSTRISALAALGNTLVELGHFAEAADAYREAVDIWHQLGQTGPAMESLAGLARVSLAQGDAPQARTQVEEIWDYLESNTLYNTVETFRIYLTCYQVFKINEDPRAQEVLVMAHRLLQEQAAKISGEKLRRSFLENVPWHQEIIKEYERTHVN